MDPEQIAAAAAAAEAAAAAAAAEQASKDAAAAAAAAAADKDKDKTPPAAPDAATAQVAELQAQLEAARAEAAKFAGLDPEKAKAAIAAAAAAETARVEAEKEKAKAEGNFERLREIQQAETERTISEALAARDAAVAQASEAVSAFNRARVEAAFATSRYLSDETILTGPKAQRLYADHIEIENGAVVVYDAPAGTAKRAKVMDAKGNPLPFNDAIAKVIGADPDKDMLLRTKTKPGAASSTTSGKPTGEVMSRHDKLKKGLQGLIAG